MTDYIQVMACVAIGFVVGYLTGIRVNLGKERKKDAHRKPLHV